MKEGEIIGSYRILSHLGSGGMAEVYRVWNESLQREEALKLLAPQYSANRSFVTRFLREAQLVAQLHHPNIAIIYSVSPPEIPQPYFTMELLDGNDLSELLHTRGGRFFEPDAVHVLSQIASGLDYAHSRGVIHRDVKPSNVLVTREGVSKLIDFGIARASDLSDSASVTQTGMIVGTPEYMSPEQARGDGQIGPATDQYSLGIMAYELLTGKVPFPISDTNSTMQVLMSHLQNPVPEPYQWDISPAVKRALLRVLSKDPEARYPSCLTFVTDLVENQPQIDVPTLPITAPRPKYLGGVVGISILGLGMISYSLWRHASSLPPPATSIPITASVSPPAKSEPSHTPLPDEHTTKHISKGAHMTRKGGVEMAFVPGGTFTMGSGLHSTVRDFWMDVTPVTVAQYREFCQAIGKAMPKAPKWGWIDDHPIVFISWNDAKSYADWAGGELPSSAQFEYAARDGGNNTEYPWGNTFDTTKLWCGIKNLGDVGKTAEVHRQSRIFVNSLGLSDMSGNVWQWCNDNDSNGNHYLKGGSWGNDSATLFRCANRLWDAPSNRGPFLGFRLLVRKALMK